MVVKQFSGGVHQEIGNQDTFDVLPGNDLTIRLNNVTDTDATRFRCTFFSSFAAPKSIIQVEIKGELMSVRGKHFPFAKRLFKNWQPISKHFLPIYNLDCPCTALKDGRRKVSKQI